MDKLKVNLNPKFIRTSDNRLINAANIKEAEIELIPSNHSRIGKDLYIIRIKFFDGLTSWIECGETKEEAQKEFDKLCKFLEGE